MGRLRMLVATGIAVGLIVVLAGCGKGETASGDVQSGPAAAGAVRLVMGTTGSNRSSWRSRPAPR